MNIILNRIRPFLLTVRRALSFVWQSSPSLAIGSIVVRVIQGLLPLVVLYLTKLLIDAVTEGSKTPSDKSSLTQITTILAGLAGVAVASAMLTVVSSLISKIQAQVVTNHMHALLQTKSVEVDLEYHENARYQDTLHRAQQEAPYRPTAILNVCCNLAKTRFPCWRWQASAHDQFAFHLDRPEIWDHLIPVSIDGQMVRGLVPEDLLIILCVHGYKHAWERLKWVADVAEVLRAQELNWKRVFSTATKWKGRRMVLLGLALANRFMEVPLPINILNMIAADHDVTMLARRMPKSMLTHQQDGIDEHDGPALYFSLKDSWWERRWYGLVLVRHGHP